MLKEFGLYGTMCLVMNEDGTGYMCFGEDDVSSITWEQGAITVDGETSPYTLEGDVLTIEEDGISMTFTRSDETPPPKPAVPAEPEPESSTRSLNLQSPMHPMLLRPPVSLSARTWATIIFPSSRRKNLPTSTTTRPFASTMISPTTPTIWSPPGST